MTVAISRMDDRLDAIETALVTALPTRPVKRSLLKHYSDYSDQELADGVVILLSAGERDYNNKPGMIAKEGTHRIILIGYLKLNEKASQPQDVEAAELDLIEEIKAFVRAGVSGTTLLLDNVQHSRQLEFPYGWVVAYIDAGPPNMNLY